MRAGDHNRTNTMFRRRIYAQGFTIAAIVAGSAYWGGDRKKRKELAETEKEKKRLERRERWLAELEARDKEEKDLKEKIKERLAKGKGSAVRKLDDTSTTEDSRAIDIEIGEPQRRAIGRRYPQFGERIMGFEQ